jgi:hypothetical protein
MYPQTHFLFSWLVALILVRLNIINYKIVFFVVLFSVLVDLDHYLSYIITYKKINFKKAWNNHVQYSSREKNFIHNKVGFLVITLISVLIYFINKNVFWILVLSYYGHILLDFIHIKHLKFREKITLNFLGFSQKITKIEVLFDILLVITLIFLAI